MYILLTPILTFYPKIDESLEPGSQRQYCLNDFELIRVIGRGSYAKVLMVELKKTSRVYAMKVIKKALVTDDEVYALRLLVYLIINYFAVVVT